MAFIQKCAIDYIDIIKKCRDSVGRFNVVKMTQDDFYDWEKLKDGCTLRKPVGIKFSSACYFKVTRSYKVGYELAGNYLQLQLAGGGTKVRLAKGKNGDSRFVLRYPPKKYSAPIPLHPLKLKDLKSFIPDLVPGEHLPKYWNAILQSSPADTNQNEDEDDDYY